MNWIVLPDRVYHISPNVVVHEVKCPICHNQATYIGDHVPAMCYVCEEPVKLIPLDEDKDT